MPKIRKGKTLKDRQSGATARNLDNKKERVAWQQASHATNNSFPRHTCNGKKNRSVFAAKKSQK